MCAAASSLMRRNQRPCVGLYYMLSALWATVTTRCGRQDSTGIVVASQQGGGDEPGQPPGGAGALWAGAPQPRGGHGRGVRRGRPVLLGGRQGAGEVRDAPRVRARRRVGDR